MSSEEKNTWEVYMIQTESGKLYTGITNNMARRFEAHQSKRSGARFFHFSSPEHIVFREIHPNRSGASKREIAIKKLTKADKLALIEEASKNA